MSCPYSVGTGLFRVACTSSLSMGLLNAGWVSSLDMGLVKAEYVCSLDTGLVQSPCLSSLDTGLTEEAGTTGNLPRLDPELRRLGLRGIGTTCTRVKGLIGLGLGPCSARIWAFWIAMRSHETRPDFKGPGRGFGGSKEGELGCGGEYLVAGSISGV